MSIPYIKTCDVNTLPADAIERARAWVAGLGLNPDMVLPLIGVAYEGDGWKLHLTEYVPSAAGHKQINYLTEECVTRPLVVPIGGQDTWPTGLVFSG